MPPNQEDTIKQYLSPQIPPYFGQIKAHTYTQTKQKQKTNKQRKKLVESFICRSATPECEAYPGVIDVPSMTLLEKTDLPSPCIYDSLVASLYPSGKVFVYSPIHSFI